jgi:hypothetical protein
MSAPPVQENIAVASSGIAATLLSGSCTAHTMLKLPLNIAHGETPVCNILHEQCSVEVLTWRGLHYAA